MSLSVNWHHGISRAVVWDSHSHRRRLSQEFIDHVNNYNSWSAAEEVLNICLECERLHATSSYGETLTTSRPFRCQNAGRLMRLCTVQIGDTGVKARETRAILKNWLDKAQPQRTSN